MKRKRPVAIAAGVLALSCCFGLIACNDKEEPPADPTDNVAPIVSGVDTVRIDLATENFNVYTGVNVTDSDDENNETDLTSQVKVVSPSDVKVDADGSVTFAKAGDYTFTYYVADDNNNATAVSRKVEVRNIYNVYCSNATLPILYFGLDIVTNDYKSMLVFSRSGTIDAATLDKDRFIYVASENVGTQEELTEMQAMVTKIAYEDEYSYFRMFANDLMPQMDLFTFAANGISSERYEVKYLSDGTSTYGGNNFPYRAEDSYAAFASNKAIYNGVYDLAIKGEITHDREKGGTTYKNAIDYNGTVVVNNLYSDATLSRQALMAAQRPNVELWCKYPENITSADDRVQAEIDKANLVKKAPDEMFNALTDEQRAEFLTVMAFDEQEMRAEYFNEEGKYLIVTGTNPVYGALGSDAKFLAVMDKIIADYPDYNILFKPHPSAIPAESSTVGARFAERGIKVMPGRLPMEIISWVFKDAKIGGFDSSLYMCVPQGNLSFFIARDASALTAVTKFIYDDGLFGTPEFYWEA